MSQLHSIQKAMYHRPSLKEAAYSRAILVHLEMRRASPYRWNFLYRVVLASRNAKFLKQYDLRKEFMFVIRLFILTMLSGYFIASSKLL